MAADGTPGLRVAESGVPSVVATSIGAIDCQTG